MKKVISQKDLENISPIFKGKAGGILGKLFMRLFAIDKVNRVYHNSYEHKGPEFAKYLLKDLGVHYSIGNVGNLLHLPDGAFITISNHPYGGLDGIILIDMIGHLRDDYKLMVNSILDHIKTMSSNFISVQPITKNSNESASNLQGVRLSIDHLRHHHPMGFFPSGAVSNFEPFELKLRDRPWQETIIKMISNANVPVLPIRFEDRNSTFFYLLGLFSWQLRSFRLPHEVFNKKKKVLRVTIGEIIHKDKIKQFKNVKELNNFLRNAVYQMPQADNYFLKEDFFEKTSRMSL